MPNPSHDDGQVATSLIRAPQKLLAGLVLIAISVFVLWAVSNLSMGTVKFMGAAMFPRSLAVIIGVCGLVLLIDAFLRDGPRLEAWSLRGPGLVFLSILMFALTIRTFGLTVASMLALVISGFATDEARPREVIIFAAGITFACVIIFRYVLDMSVLVFAIPGTSIGF